MKRSSLNAFLKFLFFLFLGLFLIWLTTRSLSSTEIEEVKSNLKSANFEILIPSLLIISLSHYFRALRWKMMIEKISSRPSTLNVFLSVLIGFFFNLVFPRLGEVMKCTLLGRHENIPVDKLVGTMVAERLVDVICLIVVISITIISQFDRVSNYANEIISNSYNNIHFSLTNGIVSLIIFLLILFIGILIYKQYRKRNMIIKTKKIIDGIFEGLSSIKKIDKKISFLGYTFLIWFLYLYCIKIGFYAMNELAGLGWTSSLTILTFGSFAMIATQGGIGAYQLAVQKTLALYEIKEVTGLAFGWLMWTVQTVFLLISGPISMLIMSVKIKNKKT